MNDNEARENKPDAEKRAWVPPTIEEVDYRQTEAQYGISGTSEFGLYTN